MPLHYFDRESVPNFFNAAEMQRANRANQSHLGLDLDDLMVGLSVMIYTLTFVNY